MNELFKDYIKINKIKSKEKINGRFIINAYFNSPDDDDETSEDCCVLNMNKNDITNDNLIDLFEFYLVGYDAYSYDNDKDESFSNMYEVMSDYIMEDFDGNYDSYEDTFYKTIDITKEEFNNYFYEYLLNKYSLIKTPYHSYCDARYELDYFEFLYEDDNCNMKIDFTSDKYKELILKSIERYKNTIKL